MLGRSLLLLSYFVALPCLMFMITYTKAHLEQKFLSIKLTARQQFENSASFPLGAARSQYTYMYTYTNVNIYIYIWTCICVQVVDSLHRWVLEKVRWFSMRPKDKVYDTAGEKFLYLYINMKSYINACRHMRVYMYFDFLYQTRNQR